MMLRSWVRSPFGSWARVKCSSWVGSSPCRLPPTLSCSLPLSRFPANQLRALLRLHEVRCGAQRVGSCAEGPPSSHGCPIPARSKVRVAAGFLLRPRRQHGCQVVGTLLSIACLLFMHFFIPVFAQKYLSFLPWTEWHLWEYCNRNLLDCGRELLYSYQMSEHTAGH